MALFSVVPSLDEFKSVSLDECMARAEYPYCEFYGLKFGEGAQEAQKDGDKVKEAVLALLSGACTMMLKPDSQSEPFQPFVVWSESRSAIPSDISDDEANLFIAVAPDIEDPDIRSRLADLAWVRKRDYRSALVAIDAYLEAAEFLRSRMWHESAARYHRAINLAASIRNEEAFNRIAEAMKAVLEGADHSWLVESLMEVLLERGLGDADAYAESSEKRAGEAEGERRWREARHMWRMASKWHSSAERAEEAKRRDLLTAETYVREAEESDSGIIRTVLYSKALEAFGRIPGSEERQKEVKGAALGAQKDARGEMNRVEIKLESEELSAHIKKLRDAVRGLSLDDALAFLANEFTWSQVSNLKAAVEQAMRDFPMQFLVSSVTLNANDRIVAQSLGAEPDLEKEHEANLRKEMHRRSALDREISVHGACEPIRQQVFLEHQPTEASFDDLLRDNPFVPAGREDIFARGLLAGLTGDFVIATSILVPQFENSLRHVLVKLGEPPMRTDRDGRQYDHDLNSMLYTEAVSNFVGEDLAFELRGLLVEGTGTNLRNELAHGLMGSAGMTSAHARYFWWFMVWYLTRGIVMLHDIPVKEESRVP